MFVYHSLIHVHKLSHIAHLLMNPMNRMRLVPLVVVYLLYMVHTRLPRNKLDCVDGLIGSQIGLEDFLVRVMSCCSYYIVSDCVL